MTSLGKTWIELHDSYITRIAFDSNSLIVGLHAVVHADAAGSAPRSGRQDVELVFTGYSLTCNGLSLRSELDVYISDGELSINGSPVQELLSSSFQVNESVELTITASPDFQETKVSAHSLHVRTVSLVQWFNQNG